jgi:hypothetical protein
MDGRRARRIAPPAAAASLAVLTRVRLRRQRRAVGLLADDGLRVIALESQPGDVGVGVVVTVDAHG